MKPEEWAQFERIAKVEFNHNPWEDMSFVETLRATMADISDDPSRLSEWWELYKEGMYIDDRFVKSVTYSFFLNAFVTTTTYRLGISTPAALVDYILAHPNEEWAGFRIADLPAIDLAMRYADLPTWQRVRISIDQLINAVESDEVEQASAQ